MDKFIYPISALIVLVYSTINAQPVVQQWVARYNNSAANSADHANALAIDSNGNVYVTGNSVNPGNDNDYLTIKYNPDSTVAWVTRVDIFGNDFAHDIVVDNAGSVYVTGQADGVFATVKYNSATGDTLWTRTFQSGATTTDEARKIALDGDGNIYITGQVNISANPATRNFATIKYNSNGDSLWVRIFDGANGADIPEDLFVDEFGNVYVAGRSDSSVTGSDFMTVKYNTNGVEKWSRRHSAPSSGFALAVTVDDFGNVYATGFGLGIGSDITTVKYDSSGVEQWVELFDGARVPLTNLKQKSVWHVPSGRAEPNATNRRKSN